ncbi:uncharacterized protein LOC117292842 [Asterias rubens]|uniref:uncharacterized protein LOC117292842 n=1 Tax=Asterias rubens TaxID=7604 RepID=UPI001454F43E|nr:uncharacterized protein LOC117292842 [Asterias rubens]
MGTKKHDVMFICLAVLVMLEFIFCLLINALAGIGGSSLGWFLNSTGDISDYYYIEITPAGWTFTIWAFIYTYQALFLLYVLTSLCRRNAKGPVYRNHVLITPVMLVMYAFNLALNVTWLFLFDRQHMAIAVVVSSLLPTTLWIMLFINHRKVDQNGFSMKHSHKCDLFLVRAIVQNGLAFYATWVTIATLLNLTIVMTYWGDLEQSVACTISLSILLVEVLIYSVLENIVWDKYLRYTYSVWVVVIFALSGSIARNWDPEQRNSIYSAVLISLAAVLFVLKIGLSMWRCCKRPLYTNKVSSESKMELALA